jgi:predicted dehydrogenase
LNEDDDYRVKPCSHVGAYLAHPAFEVAGVCDVDLKRAQFFAERFDLAGSFTKISQALAATKPKLVSVAVPYQFHSDVVHAVATDQNRPTMIFCEKPIADSIEHAESMVEACQDNGVCLYINNRRLTLVYEEFARAFQEELNSEVIVVNAWCSSGLHAIGIHMIDLMRKAFGEVAWVRGTAETEPVEQLPYSANFTPNDPRVNAQIGFKNGIVGSFVNTALTAYTYFEIEVLCRRGKLRISDNGNKLELFRLMDPKESTLSYRLKDPVCLNTEESCTLFESIATSLAEAVSDGFEHPLSALHGLHSYRVLDAMIRAADSGKTIFIET